MLNVFVREEKGATGLTANCITPYKLARHSGAFPEHFRDLFQLMQLRQRQ